MKIEEWIKERRLRKEVERRVRIHRQLTREAAAAVQLREYDGRIYVTVDGMPLLNADDLRGQAPDAETLLAAVETMRRRYVSAKAEALERN